MAEPRTCNGSRLPFVGANSIGAVIRHDVWKEISPISVPDVPAASTGLHGRCYKSCSEVLSCPGRMMDYESCVDQTQKDQSQPVTCSAITQEQERVRKGSRFRHFRRFSRFSRRRAQVLAGRVVNLSLMPSLSRAHELTNCSFTSTVLSP